MQHVTHRFCTLAELIKAYDYLLISMQFERAVGEVFEDALLSVGDRRCCVAKV